MSILCSRANNALGPLAAGLHFQSIPGTAPPSPCDPRAESTPIGDICLFMSEWFFFILPAAPWQPGGTERLLIPLVVSPPSFLYLAGRVFERATARIRPSTWLVAVSLKAWDLLRVIIGWEATPVSPAH